MKDRRRAKKKSQILEDNKENRKRRVVRKVKPKTFTKRFVIFLIILSLLIFVINAFRHPYMKVSQIYVTGNERLQDTDIISSIQNPIGKNILTYNVKKNEKKLMEKDMIEEAEIKKVFPKVINIKVTEIYPRFFIEDKEKITYISNQGRVMDSEEIHANTKNSLINIKISDYRDDIKEEFTNDEDLINFINEINSSSFVDLINQLNFENNRHIGIIIKDMRVDFGDLKESSYKIRLLESILKDVESKDLDVSSIDLSNGKNPVVEINEGS